MVKLEEVVDEEFTREQAGPEDDEWDTDSGNCATLTKHYILSFIQTPLF
jgi:hypothetical protein